jgi:peroxiredoxin
MSEMANRMKVAPGKYFYCFLLLFQPFAVAQQNAPSGQLPDPKMLFTAFYSELNKAKGQTAPKLNFTLINNKKTRSLSDFNGKILLLKFWAINCGPCRTEIPKINTLQTKFTSDELVVLYLSSDSIESQKKFFAENNVVGHKAYVEPEEVGKPYTSPLVPRSILIDQKKLIIDGWLGTLSLGEIEDKIIALLPKD